MSHYIKLYHRRYYISGTAFFSANGDFIRENNVHLLSYHMLRFLHRAGNSRYYSNYTDRLNSEEVQNLFEEFTNMVIRVIQTQKIKQELFKRTIPEYQPPTIRQHLTELLGFDVSHISIRGLLMIQRWFGIYMQIDEQSLADAWDDEGEFYDISGDKIEYTFDHMVCAMDNTCAFKEELVAKVYHPDRMDKWVNYV